MNTLVVTPGKVNDARIEVPGDKSISHRALILSAVVGGNTVVRSMLQSADIKCTEDALRALGVAVNYRNTCQGEFWYVESPGTHAFEQPSAAIDCGNSGTSLRLLSGVLAAQPFRVTLQGDDSLSRRPMQRIAEPLRKMGAKIELSASGTAPMNITGSTDLQGIDYELPVPSAQVKSAILLAALQANGGTRIRAALPSRDHTERMLRSFGANIELDGDNLRLEPGRVLNTGGAIDVPGDLSAAAFFLGLAALSEAEFEIPGVGVNPTRNGVITLLRRMGATIEVVNPRETPGTEAVADLLVRRGDLRGIEISAQDVALAIDEIPVLLVAAAQADGETILKGAGELRFKESDRLSAMAEGLRALGIVVEEQDTGLRVQGGQLKGGTVDARGDHRVAMAFAIAAARAESEVVIHNAHNIDTSYPGFLADLKRTGVIVASRAT